MASTVASEWYVNTSKHIIRKSDYKGNQERHELKLPYDALSMPALLFVATVMHDGFGFESDTCVSKNDICALISGLPSLADQKLLGYAATNHCELHEDVPGKLLPAGYVAGITARFGPLQLALYF